MGQHLGEGGGVGGRSTRPTLVQCHSPTHENQPGPIKKASQAGLGFFLSTKEKCARWVVSGNPLVCVLAAVGRGRRQALHYRGAEWGSNSWLGGPAPEGRDSIKSGSSVGHGNTSRVTLSTSTLQSTFTRVIKRSECGLFVFSAA